jgi:hypothetical protein
LEAAIARKSENKFSFEGIINGGMRSYRLEELEALSQMNAGGRNKAMDTTFNINPLNAMNATGGFSDTTQT